MQHAGALRDVVQTSIPVADFSFDVAERTTAFGFDVSKAIIAGVASALGDTAGAPLLVALGAVTSAEKVALTSIAGSRLVTKSSLMAVDALHAMAGVEPGGLQDVSPELHALSSIARMVAEFTTDDDLGPLALADIARGLDAVAQLQAKAEADERAREGFPLPYLVANLVPAERVAELVPLMRACMAAYGDLACEALGVLPAGSTSAVAALCPDMALIAAKTHSDLYNPGYLILRDDARRRVVLALRGTFRPQDVVTDLMCMHEPLEAASAAASGFVHGGMRKAAANVWADAQAKVRGELETHAGYALVLTGHSLGAGVASLLCLAIDAPSCVAFAPPCTVSRELVDDARITAVVNGDDMVCRFGLASMQDLRSAVARVNRPPAVASWAALQREAMQRPKLYPAGCVLHLTLGDALHAPVVRSRSGAWFDHLRLTGGAFAAHMPNAYLRRVEQCSASSSHPEEYVV